MWRSLVNVVAAALLGALIGAIAALVTAAFSLQSAAGGAIIGCFIGLSLGIRIAMRRQLTPDAARREQLSQASRDKLVGEVQLRETFRDS